MVANHRDSLRMRRRRLHDCLLGDEAEKKATGRGSEKQRDAS